MIKLLMDFEKEFCCYFNILLLDDDNVDNKAIHSFEIYYYFFKNETLLHDNPFVLLSSVTLLLPSWLLVHIPWQLRG